MRTKFRLVRKDDHRFFIEYKKWYQLKWNILKVEVDEPYYVGIELGAMLVTVLNQSKI